MNNPIRAVLETLIAEGKECGIQLAVYLNGKLVVNESLGIADPATGQPVLEDTLFPVFSTTKGMTATVIHLLAERGLLSYDEPVAKYWPEFDANGKSGITVRQVLNHSAGVPQVPSGAGYPEICDWDYICGKIAALAPLWEPGTRMEYHAINYGWILGEVARRVDGRPFGQLLTEEIARPLKIESTMYCGIPDDAEPRVAVLEDRMTDPLPPDDGSPQAIPAFLGRLGYMMNRPDCRRACLPATTGIMSALAIARHYAALLPGGVDGVELLPPSRVKLATEQQKPARPASDDYPRNWGLGYAIGGADSVFGGISAFGHCGYGGSYGCADPATGLAVGFTKNLYAADAQAVLRTEIPKHLLGK